MAVSEWVYCSHCRDWVKLPHYCPTAKAVLESAQWPEYTEEAEYPCVQPKPEPVPRICVNCKHYKPNEAVREHGECYLHPPQLARYEDTWVRPAVMWNHHCGQFAVNTELL